MSQTATFGAGFAPYGGMNGTRIYPFIALAGLVLIAVVLSTFVNPTSSSSKNESDYVMGRPKAGVQLYDISKREVNRQVLADSETASADNSTPALKLAPGLSVAAKKKPQVVQMAPVGAPIPAGFFQQVGNRFQEKVMQPERKEPTAGGNPNLSPSRILGVENDQEEPATEKKTSASPAQQRAQSEDSPVLSAIAQKYRNIFLNGAGSRKAAFEFARLRSTKQVSQDEYMDVAFELLMHPDDNLSQWGEFLLNQVKSVSTLTRLTDVYAATPNQKLWNYLVTIYGHPGAAPVLSQTLQQSGENKFPLLLRLISLQISRTNNNQAEAQILRVHLGSLRVLAHAQGSAGVHTMAANLFQQIATLTKSGDQIANDAP